MMYSIPLAPAKLLVMSPKDENNVALSGGSGTVAWFNDITGASLGAAIAVTWNATLLRYESLIPDSSVMARAVGDLWRGDVLIDATTPTAKRYRDVLKARVRAPSSV